MRTILLFIALMMPGLVSAQSHLTRINKPGPHAVGLRVVEQYDRSRGYRGATDPDTGKPTQGERARPIQTMIWYPAQKGSGLTMTVRDYLRLGATVDAFGHTPTERLRLEAAYLAERVSQLSPQRAQTELAVTMMARRDGLAEAGKFPVVIYAPGYVLTGPLFERVMPPLPNADERHRVPSGYWKVIATADGRVASFIIDTGAPRSAAYCAARVTLEEVELRTRLALFPRLHDRSFTDLSEALGCTRPTN